MNKHDIADYMFKSAVTLVFICTIILIMNYAISTKEFKGYYLSNQDGTEHKIWVNWENAPDEVAYRTYNKEDLLRVYKILKATEVSK